jgi:hypothetical protein
MSLSFSCKVYRFIAFSFERLSKAMGVPQRKPTLSPQSQQTPTKPPAHTAATIRSGRYQIATASAGDPAAPEEKLSFLVDTETGRVWRYRLARTVRNTDGKWLRFPQLLN